MPARWSRGSLSWPEGGFAAMDFAAFLKRVLPQLGLAPRPHLRRGVRRRLARRMDALRLRDWADYAALVESDAAERRELASLVGVTISRFFRNRSFWEWLAASVLPLLREGLPARAWSCGCASGEEPYSLVMLWRQLCPQRRLDLLATDIDAAVLTRAAEGLYPAGSLREVPAEHRIWFTEEPGGLRLAAEIRRQVTFRRHDVLAEGVPEDPFGLILCRNLAFTYFAETERAGVARKLAASLASGGFLAIGRKERLPEVAGLAAADYRGVFRKG